MRAPVLKVKSLNREEFVVIGWTDPEGARPHLGAWLLGYYHPGGRLAYAGPVGTGINQAALDPLRLAARPHPRALGAARAGRRGQIPDMDRGQSDNLLRQVVYEGLREDKPGAEVRRPVPHLRIPTKSAGHSD